MSYDSCALHDIQFLIYIYMKFLEDILNRFQVIERTRFCDGPSSKESNSKSINARVMAFFLRSARRLMLIDIYMKFREDSLNGFQVIERTRFYDRQTPGAKQYVSLP